MKNKKGIEVSVNFIVTLILAIVVFGFGVYILNRIYSQTEEIQHTLDKETEQQILRQLTDTNQPFTIPINRHPLTRGKGKLIGIGISTFGIAVDPNEQWFIRIEPSGTDNPDIVFDTPDALSGWTFPDKNIEVESNVQIPEGLYFSVPRSAAEGTTYIFNVMVCKTPTCDPYANPSEQHGRLQKIYIQVK